MVTEVEKKLMNMTKDGSKREKLNSISQVWNIPLQYPDIEITWNWV